MTSQVHNQFAKQFLKEFLSTLGIVEISREIQQGIYQARKHLAWYCKGFPCASELRDSLSRIQSVQEGYDLIEGAIFKSREWMVDSVWREKAGGRILAK